MVNDFTEDAANRWYIRNRDRFLSRDTDPIMQAIRRLPAAPEYVFEYGCSDGYRLQWIHDEFGSECDGVELSTIAISKKKKDVLIDYGDIGEHELGVPYDLIIFGFCLYLVDACSLPHIVDEVNKNLDYGGHIIIWDYFNHGHLFREYKHKDNVREHHMDYSKMFTWHPDYSVSSFDVAPEGPVITIKKRENDKDSF